MSFGRGGPNRGGNPWNQGRSFADVARQQPNTSSGNQPAAQSQAPPQETDEDGFTTVVRGGRRNQAQGGAGGGRGQTGSIRGSSQSGDRGRNDSYRGRGGSFRGQSQSHGRGRGRGRSPLPPSFLQQQHNPQNRPNMQQAPRSGTMRNQPAFPLYRDMGENINHNPSQEIHNLENEILAKNKNPGLSQKLGKLKLEDKLTLPMRPGYGTGKVVNLFANYFELKDMRNVTLYEYTVHLPEDFSQRVKRRLFTLLLGQQPLRGNAVATNYLDKIICTKKLNLDSIQVPYHEENEATRHQYTLTFHYNTSYSFGDVLDDLHSPVEIYQKDEKNCAIQALNTVIANFPNNAPRVQFVGQSRHFLLNAGDENLQLGGGLEARRGFFHSVKTSTGRLLLNLNVSTGAFFRPGNLLEVAKQVVRITTWRSSSEVPKLEKFLKKLRVKTQYGRVTQIRTIHTIAKTKNGTFASPSEVNFWWAQRSPPGNVSITEYFRKEHNVSVGNDQFVVNVGSTEKPCHIPAEFCTIIDGQVSHQKLNADQTSRMIRIACRQPAVNAMDISNNGLRLLGVGSDNGPKKKFGVTISNELLSVKGIALDAPEVRYMENKGPNAPQGSWNFAHFNLRKAGILPGNKPIGVLVVGRLKSSYEEYLRRLKGMLTRHGINWRDNGKLKIEIEANDQHEEGPYVQAFENFRRAGTPFVVALLPRYDQQIYSLIKYQGDVMKGISTVCAIEKPLKGGEFGLKSDDGTLGNIALKINLKLGGINHVIESQQHIRNIMGTTMFIGIDVTHPTNTESQSGAPSISAVVANTDRTLSQWPASITTQGHRVEMVDNDLRDMVLERLGAWTNQKTMPKQIIVYRDGVSESQYQEVIDKELVQIQKAVKTYYGNLKLNPPNITLLIVGKRHHTRFYPLDPASADRSSNVLPGTVVDRYCTMERNFDFFMVSHTGIQGTSRPAHYVVLHDANNFSAEQLQSITHDLTYVYGRASRSVSIATPAYYADIVCERGRCYLYSAYNSTLPGQFSDREWVKDVHENLKDTMFYI